MSKPVSLKDRIRTALAKGPLTAWDLAREVFPPNLYPRAYRGAIKGGPPGCYMALGRAIREMGLYVRVNGCGPGNRIVYPPPAATARPDGEEE